MRNKKILEICDQLETGTKIRVRTSKYTTYEGDYEGISYKESPSLENVRDEPQELILAPGATVTRTFLNRNKLGRKTKEWTEQYQLSVQQETKFPDDHTETPFLSAPRCIMISQISEIEVRL